MEHFRDIAKLDRIADYSLSKQRVWKEAWMIGIYFSGTGNSKYCVYKFLQDGRIKERL